MTLGPNLIPQMVKPVIVIILKIRCILRWLYHYGQEMSFFNMSICPLVYYIKYNKHTEKIWNIWEGMSQSKSVQMKRTDWWKSMHNMEYVREEVEYDLLIPPFLCYIINYSLHYLKERTWGITATFSSTNTIGCKRNLLFIWIREPLYLDLICSVPCRMFQAAGWLVPSAQVSRSATQLGSGLLLSRWSSFKMIMYT
jgi:hypothetical protein